VGTILSIENVIDHEDVMFSIKCKRCGKIIGTDSDVLIRGYDILVDTKHECSDERKTENENN
jgi:hypothetical protein